MRATLLPLSVIPAAGLAWASDVSQPDGVVRYTLTPQRGAPLAGRRARRQLATESIGQRSGTVYTINLVLGTPGQTVPVLVDTGSSELWVNPVCSKSLDPAFCNAQARFTTSNTLVQYGVQGSITWDHGIGGSGYADFNYVGDYVGVGGRSSPFRRCQRGFP